jgi:hypothetical protein
MSSGKLFYGATPCMNSKPIAETQIKALFSLQFSILIANFGFAENTFIRKYKEKPAFLLYFTRLFVFLQKDRKR